MVQDELDAKPFRFLKDSYLDLRRQALEDERRKAGLDPNAPAPSSTTIYHNNTHILYNDTYAIPIPEGTNLSDGNYTYKWVPTFASIEFDYCQQCSCCINGVCEPKSACAKIEDKVLIVCGVLLLLFIFIGVGTCYYYNRVMSKRRKEHPELFQDEKGDDEYDMANGRPSD